MSTKEIAEFLHGLSISKTEPADGVSKNGETPPSLTTMPYEMLKMILANLDKSDIKSLRLVHRHLVDIAYHFLYNTVILSSNPNDLAFFWSILHNPSLSKHVKTMVFDIQVFPKVDFDQYMECLFDQWQSDLLARKHRDDYNAIPGAVQKTLDERLRSKENMLEIVQGHLQTGYQAYHNLRMERAGSPYWKSSQYLAGCFNACTELSEVEVQTSWNYTTSPLTILSNHFCRFTARPA
ncbi:MAG: hypothetical protein Q9228_007893 [Teloschistes exilis]